MTSNRQLVAPGGAPDNILAWIVWVIGFIAAIVTIIVAIAGFRGEFTAGYLLTLVLTVIIVFAVLIAYLLRIFSLNIRVLNRSVEQLHNQVSEVEGKQRAVTLALEVARDLNDDIADLRSFPDDAQLIRFARSASRQLARSFTESLGIPCRACVKQVVDGSTARPRVQSIARSDRNVLAEMDTRHYIDANTDFRELQLSRIKVWFCNDITEYPGYENSSPNPTYRSTIVWPVLTRVSDLTQEASFAPIVAYLCLDSKEPNAFTEDAHIPLGWVVSDALARAFEANRSILT
jgi:hypothetical protein